MNSVKEITNEVPATVPSNTQLNPTSTLSSITSVFDNFSISSFTSTLMSNNMYLYILAIVAVLAFIGYYLYLKYFNNIKSEETLKLKPIESKKVILNPTQEYYLVDPNGNTILANHYFNEIVNHHFNQNEVQQPQQQPQQQEQEQQQQPEDIDQEMQEQQQPEDIDQEMQEQPQQSEVSNSEENSDYIVQKIRPKLSHPGEHTNIPDKILLTDAEDDNLANQDLNNEEILELKRQLDLMKKNQNYKVSAQNDEDD